MIARTACLLLATLAAGAHAQSGSKPVPVTVDNFIRAESDMYLARFAKEGGMGKFSHARAMVPIDKQGVVRMNRDTLYSQGVFDLDAGPVTVTLPDTGKRFMSMQVISQDHYTAAVVYGPGRFTFDKAKVGTRYMVALVRTLANPEDAQDLKAAHAAQDGIRSEQAGAGKLELPRWEPKSQARVRNAIDGLAKVGVGFDKAFGAKSEVEPIHHLVGTAIGWGGNPESAAVYQGAFPKANDGKTVHRVMVKDVPVDGFWSVSVYNAKGYFEKNDLNAYSLNNLTAKPNADGSYTLQFGGCDGKVPNCIPIVQGWNYTARLYRPRAEVLNGKWKFPEARPAS